MISKDVFRATERSELLDCAHNTIDGGPQGQAYHHWQVTDNLSCGGAATCGTSELESHTFEIDSSVNIGAISVGVSESWTSGESYACNGITAETVCVWVNVAYTIYNVKTHDDDCNEPDAQAKFPNQDQAGGGFYCVTGGDCREMNANYWQ